MDMEQLAAELEALKAESQGRREQERMGSFMDKYGTKLFKPDADPLASTGIANLILAEMDRRGVDSASEAASEAVQSVLDRLREEATTVLDTVQDSQAQVSDLMDKISTIEESVNAATAGEQVSPAVDAAMPAEPVSTPEPVAPPAESMAPPAEAAAPPADETSAGPVSAAPEAAAAGPTDMSAEAPPVEEPPAMYKGGMVPSDVRLKNMRTRFQQFHAKRNTVPSDKTLKTPVKKANPNLLAGVRGMF